MAQSHRLRRADSSEAPIAKTNKISCYILGEGTLLIQCAEVLLKRGNEILGVISDEAAVRRWANEKRIDHVAEAQDLEAFLRRQSFDFLFSIANLRLIPPNILSLPQRGTINFHDALLPRYAGLQATSWALINRETMHGVTWHEIWVQAEGGKILKQRAFKISSTETTFTLKAKCYEMGLASFEELVDELAAGTVTPAAQDLSQRTYFPKHRRPASACLIDWSRPAEEIDALIRALEFGPYPNPLGLAKAAIGTDFYLVSAVEIQKDQKSGLSPGTVIALSSESLTVATSTQDVVIRRVLALDGRPIQFRELVDHHGLSKGAILSTGTPALFERISAFNAAVCNHEEFWVKRLESLQLPSLPGAHHHSSRSSCFSSLPLALPAGFAQRLTQEPGSGRDLLIGAYGAFLARIGSEDAFCLGYEHAALLEEVSGFETLYARQVPMRIAVHASGSLEALAASVGQEISTVRGCKTFLRDVSLRFPALLAISDRRWEAGLPVAVAQVRSLAAFEPLPGNELVLVIQEEDGACAWIYNPDVLEHAETMLQQFHTFLHGIGSRPDGSVAEISLLSAAERHHLLVDWNATQRDFPSDQCIHSQFEHQVMLTPDAVALVFREQQLTYGVLNERANQVAHRLLALGVGPEVLVGICVDRSMEMVVGLLGILKAGAAYVPLDPAYPQERLATMIEDSQAPVLLTQKDYLENLSGHRCRLICLDDPEVSSAGPSHNPDSQVSPDNLAYVIFTSGSTGRPKGVMVQHRNVVNFFTGMDETIGDGKPGVWLAVTSISFDISVLELFWTLTRGFQVVLHRDDAVGRSYSIPELIAEHGVTHLQCTPSLARMLTAAPESLQALGRLKKLLLGGEALSPCLLQEIGPVLKGEIHNMYGPTETTIWSTTQLVVAGGLVSIGRPIANTEIYVVDQHLQPVPVGVPGELLIGGAGVARGYLRQPDLTREKFIVNPFKAEEPAGLLYRTGDLVRYGEDGTLKFLGRLDHQVKIRGHRIELGEIESALSQHPGLREAVVVAREDSPGDQRLVAYLVASAGKALPARELYTYLAGKLPDYMVPTNFVFLEVFPLTPNGKINRKALPAPDRSQKPAETIHLAQGADGEAAPGKPLAALTEPKDSANPLRKRTDIDQWFYLPSWKRSLPPRFDVASTGQPRRRVLLFNDQLGVGDRLAARFRESGFETIVVALGSTFTATDKQSFSIDPLAPENYDTLIQTLNSEDRVPTDIVHLWTVTPPERRPLDQQSAARTLDLSFFSPMYLAQAIGKEDITSPIRIIFVSNGLQSLGRDEWVDPVKATLLGPCRVIPREFPNVQGLSIDIELPREDSWQWGRLIDQLAGEVGASRPDTVLAYRGQDCWVQDFESTSLQSIAGQKSRIREKGVYLITGGLGGIGLVLAEHLARTARARLVLVGRSDFPAKEEWNRWLAEHDPSEGTSRKIRKLQEIEALGSELLVASADVTNFDLMRKVIDDTVRCFGALNGVIHTAGVLNDGIIQLKTPETARAVLAPKVAGTLVLDEVLRDRQLDFVFFFSSVSSIFGLAGQIDYAAADSFLDAYARYRMGSDGAFAIAVNWSAWQEVGMAAAMAQQLGIVPANAQSTEGAAVGLPFIDRCLRDTGDERLYATRFSTRAHWLLDEYRIRGGNALIPGTGYLELVRSAFEHRPQQRAVSLTDVQFSSPCVVRDGEEKELRIKIRRNGHAPCQFVIASRRSSESSQNTVWQEHVRGNVAYVDLPASRHERIADVSVRCRVKEEVFTGSEQPAHLVFGPRWRNIKKINYGKNEALLTLELPGQFDSDLAHFKLHPSLLDMATTGAQELIPGIDSRGDFFMPVSYSRIAVRGALPRKVLSHIRYRPDDSAGADFASFDVTVMDEQGQELVDISAFSMIRVRDKSLLTQPVQKVGSGTSEDMEGMVAGTRPHATANKILSVGLKDGILPAEGMQAFDRIVSLSAISQIVVSPQDLSALLFQLGAPEPVRTQAPNEPPQRDFTEVEKSLAKHAAVSESTVLEMKDHSGERRLVAHVVYVPGQRATVSELRRHLRGMLSEEMVPQTFVDSDALPRSADGKVDLGRLPNPFGLSEEVVLPRTPMELMIAEIWQELLGIDSISVYDNFFDIGGHSLLSMRLISHIDKKVGVRLLHEHIVLNTLEQLASKCEQQLGQANLQAPEPDKKPRGLLRVVRKTLLGGD